MQRCRSNLYNFAGTIAADLQIYDHLCLISVQLFGSDQKDLDTERKTDEQLQSVLIWSGSTEQARLYTWCQFLENAQGYSS